MRFPSRETVEALRREYPAGCEVELIFMDDAMAPPPGTRGKVIHVDDAGTIHVSWSTGSSLGVVPGVDSIRKIES